jgi:hypothetical protein
LGRPQFRPMPRRVNCFGSFVAQWQQCRGVTVAKTDGAGRFEGKITVIDNGHDLISAVVDLTSNSPTGIPVRVFRAVSVAKDCIVEPRWAPRNRLLALLRPV